MEKDNNLVTSANTQQDNIVTETFDTGVKKEDLPAELQPLWEEKQKLMQAGWTKKTTELANLRKDLEAQLTDTAEIRELLEDPDFVEYINDYGKNKNAPPPTTTSVPMDPTDVAFENLVEKIVSAKLKPFEENLKKESAFAREEMGQFYVEEFRKNHSDFDELLPQIRQVYKICGDTIPLKKAYELAKFESGQLEKEIHDKLIEDAKKASKMQTEIPTGRGLTTPVGQILDHREAAIAALKKLKSEGHFL